ncbi:MAG: c-type cytochrome [Gammaproteobacteria bacterium]|nr:c-type cytochrome [Gammaproteobacteria bacterium]
MRNLLITAAISILLLACTDKTTTPGEPAADLVAGKSLAEANCAGCHDLSGRGAAPGIPHLAAQLETYLLESLRAYREGKRFHAALQDMTAHMSAEEIRNVAAYYASLAPLEGTARADGPETALSPYQQGEAAAQACGVCHGADGNSEIPGTPSLAGQQPLYFVAAVRAYLSGARNFSTMEHSLRGLSNIDVQNMALYYASQAPTKREAPAAGDPVAGEPLSAQCGGCHGAHGVSHDAATPSLAGQDALYLVVATKAYRDHTRHHDVMLAESSDREIENIAAFYAVQESRAAEDGRTSAQQLIDKCDRCHGSTVDNASMAIPKLAGQDQEYLARALRAYRDDRRESSMMHKMTLPYSDTLIETVASSYANRPAR